MAEASDHKPGFSTDSLSNLCLDVIALNLSGTVARYISTRDLLELRDNIVFLPLEISEGIISTYVQEGLILTDQVLHLFRDLRRVKLTSINLSNSLVTDWSLQWLAKHPITRLDISGCTELSSEAIQKYIRQMSPNLRVLTLGDRADMLFKKAKPTMIADSNNEEDEARRTQPVNLTGQVAEEEHILTSDPTQPLLTAPNLTQLSLHNVSEPDVQDRISTLIMPLSRLQRLDLSLCRLKLETMDSLKCLPHLSSLILHDVLPIRFDLQAYLPVLTGLKYLNHLDISVKANHRLSLPYPSVKSQDEALQALLAALPLLTSLDISGTHLAGVEEEAYSKALTATDNQTKIPIPGLAGRHFKFLGLLSCVGDPCARQNIPADRVTGDVTLPQVLESLRVYQRRCSYCNDALTALYHLLKDNWSGCSDYAEVLRLICEVMRRNKESVDRQISGSAAMFYLIKSGSNRPDLHSYASTRLLRLAVRTLYSSMDYHFGDRAMLRNGLLTFCHFQLPDDGLFIYKELVTLLLLIIRHSDLRQDEFLQRISLYLINNLVRSVDNHEKLLVGDQGAVKTMLWLIKSKLDFDDPDEILEMAWSTLWNITDETEKNCERFIEGEQEEAGLLLFIRCYNKFYDTDAQTFQSLREALLRNMMGLLGNVSEVRILREKFLQPTYLNLFRQLLESTSDGIEVSYHAAGILSHILSDGCDLSAWQQCDRVAIANEMDDLVDLPNQRASSTRSTSPSDFAMVDSVCSDDDLENNVVETNEFHCPESPSPRAIDVKCEMASADPMSLSADSEPDDASKGSQSKEAVLSSLVSAINRWDVSSQRSINYRSFKPILILLECTHTVEVRHWAIWALCNLTTVYPDKYCTLLRDEGGIPLVQKLMLNHSTQTEGVITLARNTLTNCQLVFPTSDISIPDVSTVTPITAD